MSANIHQVYVANPSTVMLSTDLVYKGNSPYGLTDDSAILWSDILISIAAALPGGIPFTAVTGTVNMTTNNGYIANDPATIVTFHLPTTSKVGDMVQIDGFELGGWTLNLIAGQTIHWGTGSVTPGTGTLFSTYHHDCAILRCVVANTEWLIEGTQGNLGTT